VLHEAQREADAEAAEEVHDVGAPGEGVAEEAGGCSGNQPAAAGACAASDEDEKKIVHNYGRIATAPSSCPGSLGQRRLSSPLSSSTLSHMQRRDIAALAGASLFEGIDAMELDDLIGTTAAIVREFREGEVMLEAMLSES